jgi:hypothetical protein
MRNERHRFACHEPTLGSACRLPRKAERPAPDLAGGTSPCSRRRATRDHCQVDRHAPSPPPWRASRTLAESPAAAETRTHDPGVMSQISGGLTSADECRYVTFPQVTAFSNVGRCHGELAGFGPFVPTLCPSCVTPSRYVRLLRRHERNSAAPSFLDTRGPRYRADQPDAR